MYRIVFNTILKLFMGNTSLFISLASELSNIDNFKFNNFSISNITIFFWIAIPSINASFAVAYFMLIMLDTKEIWNQVDIICCMDNFSYPPNNFRNPIWLNPGIGQTLERLINKGAVPVPVEVGDDVVDDLWLKKDKVHWFRVNSGLYYRMSYLKGQFTKSIESFYSREGDIVLNRPFSMNIPTSYINNRGVISKFSNLAANPGQEDKVDGLIGTILPHFFGSNRGYGFNPQAKDSSVNLENVGKVDYMVDFDNASVLLVEDKTDTKSSDSWLDVIQQVQRYAKNNDSFTSIFVMIMKGVRMSCFIYEEDFHSSNHFNLKHPFYQDLIGLQVTQDGISLMPQCNTYYPQFKIYDTSPSARPSDILATTALLTYLSNFRDVRGVDYDNGEFSIRTPSRFNGIEHREVASHQPGLGLKLKLDAFGKFRVSSN